MDFTLSGGRREARSGGGASWVSLVGSVGATSAILVALESVVGGSWLLLRRTLWCGASLQSSGFPSLRWLGRDLAAYRGELLGGALEQVSLFLLVVLPRLRGRVTRSVVARRTSSSAAPGDLLRCSAVGAVTGLSDILPSIRRLVLPVSGAE